MRRNSVVALLLFIMLSPAVSAGVALVPQFSAKLAALPPGGSADFVWTFVNEDFDAYQVVVSPPELGDGWNATAFPQAFTAASGSTTNITVRVTAPTQRQPPVHSEITALVYNQSLGVSHIVKGKFAAEVRFQPLVLALFENPLPAPLNNEYGVFLLDIFFWAAVGIWVVLFQDPIIRLLAGRAPKWVVNNIIVRLRGPVLALIVFFGAVQSLHSLPQTPVISTISQISRALLIGVIAYVVYLFVHSFLFFYGEHVAKKTTTKLDDVLVPLLDKISAVGIGIGAILYYLGTLGFDLTVFLAGSFILTTVIAFAAQDTISNFFSGVFLLLDQPFAEGEEIMLESGEYVRVERIGLRSTRLYHGKNHELIVVPNNQLASKRVVNLGYPDQKYRVFVKFGVAYGTDPEKVRKVVLGVITSHEKVVKDPVYPAFVQLSELGDSSVNFIAGFLVDSFRDRYAVRSDVTEGIYKALMKEKIEIPFPQRVVRLMKEG
ncbi:MAG: mechanosensitive ion channel [Euryarchaeota archaeon]|nr:mechanosensitive ion channel [Euryarchaeota archaeon]